MFLHHAYIPRVQGTKKNAEIQIWFPGGAQKAGKKNERESTICLIYRRAKKRNGSKHRRATPSTLEASDHDGDVDLLDLTDDAPRIPPGSGDAAVWMLDTKDLVAGTGSFYYMRGGRSTFGEIHKLGKSEAPPGPDWRQMWILSVLWAEDAGVTTLDMHGKILSAEFIQWVGPEAISQIKSLC